MSMNKEKMIFRLLNDLDSKTNDQATTEEKKIYLDKIFNESLESASMYVGSLIKKYSSESQNELETIIEKLRENNDAVLICLMHNGDGEIVGESSPRESILLTLCLISVTLERMCCERHKKEFKDHVMRILRGE